MSRRGPGTGQGLIPITMVGGFLGSGKTTFLRRRYLGDSTQPTAAIINEFSAEGVDHLVVDATAARMAMVSGGCACCERLPQLVEALRTLVADRDSGRAEFDRIVIETSGLADPAPIVAAVAGDPVLRHRVTVEAVVVMVDGVNGGSDLDEQPEAAKQVAIADELVVTKSDLVDPEQLECVARRIQRLSPAASVSVAVNGEVESLPRWPAAAEARPKAQVEPHEHRDGVTALSIRTDTPLDWVAFSVWLSMLLHARGDDVLRVKGVANVAGFGPVSLNGVQSVLHEPEHLGGGIEEDARTDLVFITRNVEPGLVERSMEVFQKLGR